MNRDKRFILFNLPSDSFSIQGLGLLAILYFGSLTLSAIISPIVFNLAHYFDPDASSYIAGKPYPDYFDRGRLLFALILSLFLFCKCGMTSGRKLGYTRPVLATIGKWFAYGVLMMGIIYGYGFIFGTIEPRENWSWGRQISKIESALIGALIVGLVEETLFRGLVFRIFYTAFRPWLAILVSSAFFALMHFKMDDEAMSHIAIADIGIDDGFVTAWKTMIAFTGDFNLLLFGNLTLVGIILHQCFLYTKNLWAPIGLHMGWVTVILSLSKTFSETDKASNFSGTERVLDGYWVGLVMIVFAGLFAFLINRQGSGGSKEGNNVST